MEILADCFQNRQSAKINSPPNFLAIRYVALKKLQCSLPIQPIHYTYRIVIAKSYSIVDSYTPISSSNGVYHHIKADA